MLKDRKLAVLEGQKLKSLDKYSKSYVPETYSNRVSAITPGSAALLDGECAHAESGQLSNKYGNLTITQANIRTDTWTD